MKSYVTRKLPIHLLMAGGLSCFCANVPFYCFLVQVKLTVERMKAGFEESLRERDELHERNLRSLQEQNDRGKLHK